MQTQRNEYDETKKFLNKIRKITKNTAEDIREQLSGKHNIIKEQIDSEDDEFTSLGKSVSSYMEKNPVADRFNTPQSSTPPAQQSTVTATQNTEKSDFAVINNVEVAINSTDRADLQLTDEEKGKISQLIDDFRSEVSEIAEFGRLNIYSDSAKLDGNIKEVNLGFTISAGDDNGIFLSNSAMLQINDNSMGYIDKLKKFQIKFNDVMGEIIANRQQN